MGQSDSLICHHLQTHDFDLIFNEIIVFLNKGAFQIPDSTIASGGHILHSRIVGGGGGGGGGGEGQELYVLIFCVGMQSKY